MSALSAKTHFTKHNDQHATGIKIFYYWGKRATGSLRAVILKEKRFPTQFPARMPTQYHCTTHTHTPLWYTARNLMILICFRCNSVGGDLSVVILQNWIFKPFLVEISSISQSLNLSPFLLKTSMGWCISKSFIQVLVSFKKSIFKRKVLCSH